MANFRLSILWSLLWKHWKKFSPASIEISLRIQKNKSMNLLHHRPWNQLSGFVSSQVLVGWIWKFWAYLLRLFLCAKLFATQILGVESTKFLVSALFLEMLGKFLLQSLLEVFHQMMISNYICFFAGWLHFTGMCFVLFLYGILVMSLFVCGIFPSLQNKKNLSFYFKTGNE